MNIKQLTIIALGIVMSAGASGHAQTVLTLKAPGKKAVAPRRFGRRCHRHHSDSQGSG